MSNDQETPILFNGPMVRAILEGRKTQTRRIVLKKRWLPGEARHYPPEFPIHRFLRLVECPYGIPGDHLWVRESWRIASLPYDECPAIQYRADNAIRFCDDPSDPVYGWDDYRYEAWFERMNEQLIEDCEKAGLQPRSDLDMYYTWEWDSIPTRWRPSIHMPRWASRITLEVKGVRVERVQEISEEDARAEGCDSPDWPRFVTFPDGTRYALFHAREGFEWTWDQMYAKRGYGWNLNPWVWVIEFRVR